MLCIGSSGQLILSCCASEVVFRVALQVSIMARYRMNLHSASADHNILMTSSLKLDLMFRNHNVVIFGAKLSVVVMMFFDKASTDRHFICGNAEKKRCECNASSVK